MAEDTNEDWFFTKFESMFLPCLSGFYRKVINKSEVSQDLRDTLKNFKRDWDSNDLTSKVCPKILSNHFAEIKDLLNKWHHKGLK